MVTRHSSRLGGNRPRTHPSSGRENRSIAAQSKRSEAGLTPETARELKFISLRLKHARAVIVTAVAALWHQNADHDADIALALQHAVAHPLLTEIERLEKLIGAEAGGG